MLQLLDNLSNLAAEWRSLSRGIDQQDEIVAEYHQIMKHLYNLHWDDVLDADSELPDGLMPAEYKRRHPKI